MVHTLGSSSGDTPRELRCKCARASTFGCHTKAILLDSLNGSSAPCRRRCGRCGVLEAVIVFAHNLSVPPAELRCICFCIYDTFHLRQCLACLPVPLELTMEQRARYAQSTAIHREAPPCILFSAMVVPSSLSAEASRVQQSPYLFERAL